MKGLLIDAASREVREVEYAYGNIASTIGTGNSPFCLAGRLPTGDAVLVDDEGMLKPFTAGFRVRGMRTDDQPMCGSGLVIGQDTDDSTDPPQITAAELLDRIEWVDAITFVLWMHANRDRAAATLHVPGQDATILATYADLRREQPE